MRYPLISFAFWIRIRGYGIAIGRDNSYVGQRGGFRIFGVKFQWVKP